MSDDGPERLYNSRQVREALNISERTFRQLTSSGKLRAVRQGAFVYVRQSVLDEYLNNLPWAGRAIPSPVMVLIGDNDINGAAIGQVFVRAECDRCAQRGWLLHQAAKMKAVGFLCDRCYLERLQAQGGTE